MTRAARTRADRLCRDLQDEIFQGILNPGDRLDEQSLAERFNVSRTPVREALRQLTTSGLAEHHGHHGVVVKTLSIQDLAETYLVLAELEGLSARLATRRITPEEIKNLERANEACNEQAEKNDWRGFLAADLVFHGIIWAAARNHFLEQQIRAIRDQTASYWIRLQLNPLHMKESVANHALVASAIAAGNKDEAGRLFRYHLDLPGRIAGDFIAALRGNAA